MTTKQGILDRLEVELTQEFVDRLVAYSCMKAERRPWYGLLVGRDPSMAEGRKPEDIVQTVICKTIRGVIEGPGKGRRMWDGGRDLYDHLTSQIDSELSNLGRSWANQNLRLASQMEPALEKDGRRRSPYETVVDESKKNPEEDVLGKELESRADEFVGGFLDFLGEDDFLVDIVERILDGMHKPREIAAALDVQVEEIYKARKRLRRRIDDYRASLSRE